jgi:aspartate carbamoyltransferase catalytic subunit
MFSTPFVLEKIQDLSLEQIAFLFQLAAFFKKQSPPGEYFPPQSACALHKEGPKGFISFFQEPSTRTKLSFHKAASLLHLHQDHMLKDQSSLVKGEGLEQMFVNLAHLGFHLCVYRTPKAHELSTLHTFPPLSIINAGDGDHEHPTQALGDLFTFIELQIFKGPRPAIILMGDILYSRVAHSLMHLLPLWGIKLYLCCPDEKLVQQSFLTHLLPHQYTVVSQVEEVIDQVDGIYLFRFQKERHPSSYLTEQDYTQQYGLTFSRYQALGKHLPLFHAGPANIGVEIDQQLFHSSYFYAYQQVHHGVFLRMALIDALLYPKVPRNFYRFVNAEEFPMDSAGSFLPHCPPS